MKATRNLVCLGVSLWLLAIPAAAQFYPPMSIDPALLKFLPEDAAFTAVLETTTYRPASHWPVRVALLNGKTRVEMDVAKMEQKQKVDGWADYVRQMQQAGSAECVSIFNPDEKSLFTVLPKVRAYLKQAIPDDELPQLKNRPVAQRLEMGTEDIDGRVAVKTKLTFSKTAMDVWRTWETPEAVVWTAKDSPGIPLRIQVMNAVGETNATLVFKIIDLRKPAPELFKPAANLVKCDEQKLMERIMEKWPKDK